MRPGAIRLGLRMIVGLPRSRRFCKLKRRDGTGPFQSLDDFAARSGVSRQRGRAAGAGRCLWIAAASIGGARCGKRSRRNAGRAINRYSKYLDHDEPAVLLPAMGGRQEVFADYQTAGLSLKAHPISFYRERNESQLGIVPAAQLANLKNGRFVRVGGLVLVRQRPGTAKGITFVTIEDETGTANLIMRMDVWERFYQVARTASAYIAHGRLQKEKEVIHVLVTKLENLAETLQGLRTQSRDFQ